MTATFEHDMRSAGTTDLTAYRYGDADESQLKIDLFLPGGENA